MPQAVSRAVIEVLLDRVSQGAGAISPEGQLTYANQRFASMLGVNRGQLIGKLTRANGDGDLQALLTFAPLGHGQVSCIVTKDAG